jgi:hypothetical protein
MLAGQAALAAGHRKVAEEQFDAALLSIDAIYADNEAAEKARSLWHAEGVKDFKGEPYERVMAFYYRGLLYLMAGDWDNAQASFKGGVLQDSFAALERDRADVASLIWLEGWARRCGGSDSAAADLFAEAASLRPALKAPPPEADLVVVAETGGGPRKAAAGKNGEKLVYWEGPLGNDRLVAVVGGRKVEMAEAENLYFQAVSRGGRQMDDLLADKADTKDTVHAVGKTAAVAGLGTAAVAGSQGHYGQGNRNAAAAGAIIGLVGLLAMAAAEGMNAHADTRAWDTLPHSIHIAALQAPGPISQGDVDLEDGVGRKLLSGGAHLQLASVGRCSLVWVDSGSIMASRSEPVVAVPANGGGGDAVANANCRTPSGAGAFLPPEVCTRIGGTVLTLGPPPVVERVSCRVPSGSLSELPPAICDRVGGAVVR